MASYSNPVVRGHAPDPSAVRVGDDYFLATSSFGFQPGIPIRHSTDLVHWRTIGFAVSRPAQYRRDAEPGSVVLFAPTIRYHGGTFFVTCTNVADGQGNFIVSTTDPAGDWSDAVWLDRDWFDPSLFRDDDGTWLYQRRELRFRPDGNLGPIVQAEVDVRTGALGEFHELTTGNRGFASNDIEGPHLYRIGDWYYLCAAEGGSWKGHMQTIGRARAPWGPFEPAPGGPILTHRDRTAHPIQTVGHAELVEAADGRWWALSLGTRHAPFTQHHNLGRETFLTPVTWNDGWPVVGDQGRTELEFDDVVLPAGTGSTFDVADTLWSRGWTTLGAPPVGLDPAGGADGAAIDLPLGGDPASGQGMGALLRAQSEHTQRFGATVESVDGRGVAGIGVWTDAAHHYTALIAGAGADRAIEFRRVVDDLETTARVAVPGDSPVRLVVESSVPAYSFAADVDGERLELGAGAARLLSAESAEWFVNANFALFAIGTDGSARFTGVTFETLPDAPPVMELHF